MILLQKKIRKLLFIVAITYITVYLLISRFRILTIENIYIFKYVIIGIFFISMSFSVFLIKSMKPILVGYSMIGIALILFLISSIFIFKIQDLFFWDAKRTENREFFDFAFMILGCNYILAIPYLLLLISEIAFIRSNR